MPPRFPVKILFVGDVHLGRGSTRIPSGDGVPEGFREQDLGPLASLKRAVQLACDERVDAVAFAGDLVHAEQNLFAARHQLQEALMPLQAAEIPVLAIAGNHDTRILPLLAAEVDGLQLVGPHGTWSSHDVTTGVRLAGWSFPARHHAESPLLQPPPQPEPGIVTIGLLHADLDMSQSRYAPVSSGELAAVGYDAWVLGHTHAPDPVPGPAADRRPFYLGSLGAVPPTETGLHGPVLATISSDGKISWARLPIAPLRWEHLTLSVDELSAEHVARDAVDALRAHLFTFVNALEPESDPAFPLRALGLRITLTGSHPAATELTAAIARLSPRDLVSASGDLLVFIDKLTAEINVPIDLVEAARNADPPGLLARRILALENNDPAAAEILQEARLRFAEVSLPTEFSAEQPTDDTVRRYLIRAGHQALNALLAQKTGGAT